MQIQPEIFTANETTLTMVVVGLLIVLIAPMFIREKGQGHQNQSKTTSNAGYVDFTGGRLTERTEIDYSNIEIKDIVGKHGLHQ